MKFGMAFCALLFLSGGAEAQNLSLQPTGVNGSVGAGFVLFNIQAPGNLGVKLDNGAYLAVGGEKGFGVLHLYLTFSLGYLKTTGESLYDYSALTTHYTTTTPVQFDSNLLQAGLGLRFKLIQDYWFRPYVEAGGVGGYFQIAYKNLATALGNPTTTDYKSNDSLLDFGTYYEGGLEISFSNTFGMRVAARATQDTTKPFVTFRNQALKYSSQVYYLSALKSF